MRETDEKELRFVARYYKEHHLNAARAWKKFVHREGRATATSGGMRQWVAVAACTLLAGGIIAACVVTGYRHYRRRQPVPAPSERVVRADSVMVMHFNNEPVGEVMRRLSAHYGCRLSASDSTKRVSGDIQIDSLQTTIDILEQILDIKVTVR